MDREEKNRTESGAQKRPVHRKRRRTDGSTPRKTEQVRKRRKSGRQGERMSAKKRQQKRTRFNVVSSLILVAAVCVFVFSLYQLVTMLIPYYSGGKIYDEIKNIAITAD